MEHVSRYAAAVLAACALLSCQQSAPRLLLEQAEDEQLRWPAAPAPVRIVHLAEISGEEGFTPHPTFLQRLARWLLGDSRERLVRPAALSVRGDALAIADPGQAAVHLLDLSARRWRTLRVAAGELLVSPVGVLLLPDGRLLVADSVRQVIWSYDASGEPRGRFTEVALSRPTGLTFEARQQRVWVAETLGHRLRAFDLQGREVDRVGVRGSRLGEFNYPTRVAAAGDGGLWVTDSLNFRLQYVDAAGWVGHGFGVAGNHGGAFARPRGLAIDGQGRVFVVDALFDAIQIFDKRGRLLLEFGQRGVGPGEFWLPSDVTLDRQNRVYVADSYNRRIQIFAYYPPDAN